MKLGPIPALVSSLLMITLGALGTGCAMENENVDDTAESATVRPQSTICFSGRSLGSNPYDSGGNSEFGALCKQLPNLIEDVSGPDAAYPFFRWNSSVPHAVDVIVKALDTNHDGVVTNTDAPMDLVVVGYSWGGFNARDLAKQISTDWRFSPLRKGVATFIALDPYRTDDLIFAKVEIDISANVGTYYEFRHTVAPADDCSRIAFGLIGPFTGRNPECTGSTVCHDYDYSDQASTAWVDHCAVPGEATRNVIDIVAGRTPQGLPPERRVARY